MNIIKKLLVIFALGLMSSCKDTVISNANEQKNEKIKSPNDVENERIQSLRNPFIKDSLNLRDTLLTYYGRFEEDISIIYDKGHEYMVLYISSDNGNGLGLASSMVHREECKLCSFRKKREKEKK